MAAGLQDAVGQFFNRLDLVAGRFKSRHQPQIYSLTRMDIRLSMIYKDIIRS